MSENIHADWFEGIETIIADPLRFKAKLAIGEDAYTSLRVKNAVFEIWDVAGAAGTAVAIAQSSTVASTFFAPSGVLAFWGFGTGVTPIGWVIAAGVIGAVGWTGITRYLKETSGSRVTKIPDFINTPMDVLALGLFDLMAPLALKVASIDGNIDISEKEAINSYFVKQWGYDPDFVRRGMEFTEGMLSDFSIHELAKSLAEFKKHNKDCNYKVMSREIVDFLRLVIEADGRIDEREELAIEKIQTVFNDVGQFKIKEEIKNGAGTVSVFTKKGFDKISEFSKKFLESSIPMKKD